MTRGWDSSARSIGRQAGVRQQPYAATSRRRSTRVLAAETNPVWHSE